MITIETMKYKVLITTSGLGSRLGDLTDYTNKSLVRVGNKPTLSYIIESYPSDTDFVITLGHYADYVKQFIEISYPNLNFEFAYVDNYSGPGSSLAYSILQAENFLQCPFIFHPCDTILKNNEILHHTFNNVRNFCVGAKKDNTSQYTTLITDKKKVIEIKNKGEINYDFAYTGISGIKNYKIFWKKLKNIYNSDKLNSSLFEGTVINEMLKTVEFELFETKSWFDTGNTRELEKTRKHFSTFAEVLEKKEESIYFFDDFIIKFFADENINKNRVNRTKFLNNLTPKIIDQKNNFYKYEKIDGNLFAKTVNTETFKHFLNWSKKNLWLKEKHSSFKNLCYVFYVEKTLKRIDKYLKNEQEQDQLINGVAIPKIHTLLNSIDRKYLCEGIPTRFHGDFILDNILETSNGFCLLDWRQDFAGELIVGDMYYDLAKLNHNLTINHEIVNKKLYNHSVDNCYILCNTTLIECKKVLKNFVIENGYDYKKVEILTSLIWINMAPLHQYPFNKFLFNFGKYNLHKALQDE